MGKEKLLIIVNKEEIELEVEPHWTLLHVLREELGFTGAKEGCGLGSCGACTVLMDGEPILSCLTLAVESRGKKITTIEGLFENGKPHPLQQSFVDHGAIQCGFCTPGMILSSKALIEKHKMPSKEQIQEALSGNLCRCTGYNKIVQAVESVADESLQEH